jgi:hypothetical protein
MIERVAKALVASRRLPDGCLINWDVFRADARAAIEAMREPTEAMQAVYLVPGSLAEEDIWPAMIDAALGPPVEPQTKGATAHD